MQVLVQLFAVGTSTCTAVFFVFSSANGSLLSHRALFLHGSL